MKDCNSETLLEAQVGGRINIQKCILLLSSPVWLFNSQRFYVVHELVCLLNVPAGGIGIHRPVNKTKPGTKAPPKEVTGTEYRSKKAKGDVKKKGLPDPYAYMPLRKDTLNKRYSSSLLICVR